MPGLRPDQVQQIRDFIHDQQIINAIKLYREATGAGLADAKEAVEEMARGENIKPPSRTADYDNPILESRIKLLLSKSRKIDAVRIYREEYGVGLKEAKNAVDRIEASMRSEGPSMSMPYDSAIREDPFAEDDGRLRRSIILAAAVAILVCGMGAFFLMTKF